MKSPRVPIPVLLFDPDKPFNDTNALYGTASAFSHSGQIINHIADDEEKYEFFFPAIVCSSFAIELFLKLFIVLDHLEKNQTLEKAVRGHKIKTELWPKISDVHQDLIIGIFQNPQGNPRPNIPDILRRLFFEALDEIGDQPFADLRYPHEFTEIKLISHEALLNVSDALQKAANHVMFPKSK